MSTSLAPTSKIPPQLLRIEEAQRLISECVRVDEARDIRDFWLACETYCRERHASLGVQNDAADVRLRAERRIGELLREMPKAKGSAQPGVGRRGKCGAQAEPHSNAPTLSDLSITKKQSSVWQKIADIEEEEFEDRIAEAKKNGIELTTSRVLRPSQRVDCEPEPFHILNAVPALQAAVRRIVGTWPTTAHRAAATTLRDLADEIEEGNHHAR